MSKTYIPVAPSGIAAGAVSRVVQPGSAMAAHVQVILGSASAVAIEGAIVDTEKSQPLDSDFVEYGRIASSGIHPMKMLPSVYRFRAIGGDVALVAVVHYPDAKMVPDVLPPSVNDIENLVDPLIQPVQSLAEQADVKADTASDLAAAARQQVELRRTDLAAGVDVAGAARVITDAGAYDILPDGAAPAANGRDVLQLPGGRRAVWHKRKIHSVDLAEFAGLRGDNNTDIADALEDALRLLRLDGAGPVGKIYMPQQTVPGNPPQAYVSRDVDLNLATANTAEAYRVDIDLGALRLAPGAGITVRDGWRTRIQAYLTGGAVGDVGLTLTGLQYPIIDLESVGYAGTTLSLPGQRSNGTQCTLVTIARLIAVNGERSLVYGPEGGGYCDAQGIINKITEIGMSQGTLFRNARDLTVAYHENHQANDGIDSLTITTCGAIHYGKVLLGEKGTLISVGGDSNKISFQEAYLTGGNLGVARGLYVGPQARGVNVNTLYAEGLAVGIEYAPGAQFEIGSYISDGNNTLDMRWNNSADSVVFPAQRSQHISVPHGVQERPVQLPVPASPKFHENTTGRTQVVYINGGTGVTAQIGRLGVLFPASGVAQLAPGDYVRIDYTSAPTVWLQQL